MEEEKMYVLVGKEMKESKSSVTWALHNSGGKKLCILHVHLPSQRIPLMGSKFPISQLQEHHVKAYHDKERQDMQQLLEKYSMLCAQAGVQAEKLHIEMDSIEKGILELISQHGIRKLVMGAAADKQYSRKMKELKSKKAIFVNLQAPVSCHIWFVCKGNLIYTRRGNLEGANGEVSSPVVSLTSPNSPIVDSTTQILRSVSEGRSDIVGLTILTPDFRRERNGFISLDGTGRVTTPSSRLSTEGSSDVWDGMDTASMDSCFSLLSSSEVVGDLALISSKRDDEGEIARDGVYELLARTMNEAENSRKEAFEESVRRMKAEKDVIEAIYRAKLSESSYLEELRRRKESEEAQASGKEELEKMKAKLDEVMDELRLAQEHESSLEIQIRNSGMTVEELEQKIVSAVELLQHYKQGKDELEVERDHALSLVEELMRKRVEDASTSYGTQCYSEFLFSEIEEATHNFDPSLKIGEGVYGSIYRGLLRHTPVAIKMLQGPLEFQQEINVLSKLRHPNLVALIGACPEAWILVYEYLPKGSLEDRLNCKDNTSPLPWQTRIRIATELCSVLIFLHSCKPHSVILHGDLIPDNILLDTNHVSKLSDLAICGAVSEDRFSCNSTTLCCRTDSKGTIAYMDPEFLSTGVLTRKSDVYSFGKILLRLLTGRPDVSITKEVQNALDNGKLKDFLDPTAGEWPFLLATQLTRLALSCCEMDCSKRPDFASEIWRILEPMRVSCGVSSIRLGSEDDIPTYFTCPIFQEVMQDPVVASDGFTYEAEALKGWLESGHDTSPMTNLKLPNNNLLPNHSLRSAIKEWLQQPL